MTTPCKSKNFDRKVSIYISDVWHQFNTYVSVVRAPVFYQEFSSIPTDDCGWVLYLHEILKLSIFVYHDGERWRLWDPRGLTLNVDINKTADSFNKQNHRVNIYKI